MTYASITSVLPRTIKHLLYLNCGFLGGHSSAHGFCHVSASPGSLLVFVGNAKALDPNVGPNFLLFYAATHDGD